MAKQLTFIDLCAGIGGFRHGLETAGLKCIGFAEFNEPARRSYQAMYDTEGEWTARDINDLKSKDIPKADVWTFGFPCQDISLAGKQAGLAGERSGLFYKIVDLVKGKKENEKPQILIAENVKNLLRINGGRDFARVLIELDAAGYDTQWQVVNSKDFGVPQNRERVYIVGLLRTGRYRGRKILPIRGTSRSYNRAGKELLRGKRKQAETIRDINSNSQTLTSDGGGISGAGRTGLYAIPETKRFKEYGWEEVNAIGREAKCLRANYQATVAIPNKLGRLERDGVRYLVRRLTPRECFRLQGFPDRLFDRAASVNPESELYKQAGNAVTATIPYEIGKSILKNN